MTSSDRAFTPLVIPRVGGLPTDLRGEGERARTRGYAEGFAEGRRVALEEARAESAATQARMRDSEADHRARRASALNAVHASSAALDRRTAELGSLAAARVEELAVELATAIIGAELSDPARSASHALRRALAEIPVDRWTRVTMHPRDIEILREDAEATSALDGIEIAGSDSVDLGGAIVAVADGAVDTRITLALARVSAMLSGDGDGQGEEVLA